MEPDELNVIRDLDYIHREIISKTNKSTGEKTYIKFSRILNAVSIIGGPKSQFEKYWSSKYQKRPEEHKQIMEAIQDLFEDGLTPPEKMIKLIENSNDRQSEKDLAISLLIPKTSPKEKSEEIVEKTEARD